MFVLGFCRMQTSLRINRKSDEKWGMWSSWIFSASGYTMHTFTLAFPMVTRTLVYRRITNRARPWKWICRHVGEGDPNPTIPVSATQNVNSNQPKKGNESGKFSTLPSCPRKKFKELIRKRDSTKLLLVVPLRSIASRWPPRAHQHLCGTRAGEQGQLAAVAARAAGAISSGAPGGHSFPGGTQWRGALFGDLLPTNGYICLHENHNNQLNVGKYSSPMDPMGCDLISFRFVFFVPDFCMGKGLLSFLSCHSIGITDKKKQNEALDDSPSLPFEFPIMPYFFAGFFRALISRCPSSGVGFPLWRFEFVKAADPKKPHDWFASFSFGRISCLLYASQVSRAQKKPAKQMTCGRWLSQQWRDWRRWKWWNPFLCWLQMEDSTGWIWKQIWSETEDC